MYEKIAANIKKDFKVGIQDIAEGFQTAGLVAEQSGLKAEEFAGSIAKVAEVTRMDGSQIGNAMKTILARTSRSKEADPDTSAKDRSKAAESLKDVGINVFDINGNYQDFGTTLDQLSEKWDTLSDAQRANIAESMAGVKNLQVMNAMMETWGEAKDLARQVEEDPDFFLDVQEKSMDSLQSKMDTFKANIQDFWHNFLDTGFIGGAISTINELLEALNKLISTINSIPVVGKGLGYGLLGITALSTPTFLSKLTEKRNKIKEIRTPGLFEGVGGAFAETMGEMSRMGLKDSNSSIWEVFKKGAAIDKNKQMPIDQYVKQANMETRSLARDLQFIKDTQANPINDYVSKAKANPSGNSLKKDLDFIKTIKNEALNTGVGLTSGLKNIWNSLTPTAKFLTGFSVGTTLIAGAVKLFDTLVDSSDEIHEKAEIEVQDRKKSIESYKQAQDVVKNYSELEELSKGVDTRTGENISLSEESFKRYHELTNQIAENFPSLVSGFDAESNAILKSSVSVRTLNEELKKMNELNLADNISKSNIYQNDLKTLSSKRGWFTEFKDGGWDKLLALLHIDNAELGKSINYEDAFNTLGSMIGKSKSEVTSIFDSQDDYMKSYLKGLGIDKNSIYNDFKEISGVIESEYNRVESKLTTTINPLKQVMKDQLSFSNLDGELDSKTMGEINSFIDKIDISQMLDLQDKGVLPERYAKNIYSAFMDNPDLKIHLSNLFELDDDSTISDMKNAIKNDVSALDDALKNDSAAEIKLRFGLDKSDELFKQFDDTTQMIFSRYKNDFVEIPKKIKEEASNKTDKKDSKEIWGGLLKDKNLTAEGLMNLISSNLSNYKDQKSDKEKQEQENKTKQQEEKSKADVELDKALNDLLNKDLDESTRFRLESLKNQSNPLNDLLNEYLESSKKLEEEKLKKQPDYLKKMLGDDFKKMSEIGLAESLKNQSNPLNDLLKGEYNKFNKSSHESLKDYPNPLKNWESRDYYYEETLKKLKLEEKEQYGGYLNHLEKRYEAEKKLYDSDKKENKSKKPKEKHKVKKDDTAKSIEKISKDLEKAGVNTTSELSKIPELLSKYGNYDKFLENLKFDLFNVDEYQSVLDNLRANLELIEETLKNVGEAFDDSVDSSGMAKQSIDNIVSAYGSLNSFDYDKLFESTAMGVRINTEELHRLNAEYEKGQSKKYEDELKNLETQYQRTCQEISNTKDKGTELNSLLSKRDGIKTHIDSLQELMSMYDGLTNKVAAWERANKSAERGDLYDKIQSSGLKDAKERYDKGEVSTEKFRSFVDMMTHDDMSNASVDKIVAAYESGIVTIKSWFTEEPGQGLSKFLTDLHAVNSELAYIDDQGHWQINADVEEMAKGLDISQSMVTVLLDKLSDMGFSINFKEFDEHLSSLKDSAEQAMSALDKPIDGLNLNVDSIEDIDKQLNLLDKSISEAGKNSDLKKNLETIKSYLEALKGEKINNLFDPSTEEGIKNLNKELDVFNEKTKAGIEINWENQDPESIAQQLREIGKEVSKLDYKDGHIDMEAEGAVEALHLIDALQQRYRELKKDSISDFIDVETLDATTRQAVGAFDRLWEAKVRFDEVDFKKKLGFEIDETQVISDLNAAIAEITNGENETLKTVLINAGVELDSNATPEEIAAQIGTVGIPAILEALGIEGIGEDGQVNVHVKKDEWEAFKEDVALPRNVEVGVTAPNAQNVKIALDDAAKDRNSTIHVYTVKHEAPGNGGMIVSGPGQANGTANVRGTAFAKGNWGAKKSSTSLVGELGKELVN